MDRSSESDQLYSSRHTGNVEDVESGSGSVLRKTESTAHAHQSRARIVPGYRARASHHASTQLSRALPHTQYEAVDVPYRCVSIIRDSLVMVQAVFYYSSENAALLC